MARSGSQWPTSDPTQPQLELNVEWARVGNLELSGEVTRVGDLGSNAEGAKVGWHQCLGREVWWLL